MFFKFVYETRIYIGDKNSDFIFQILFLKGVFEYFLQKTGHCSYIPVYISVLIRPVSSSFAIRFQISISHYDLFI